MMWLGQHWEYRRWLRDRTVSQIEITFDVVTILEDISIRMHLSYLMDVIFYIFWCVDSVI